MVTETGRRAEGETMMWMETDTSEFGDRWTLLNSLGISVRLSVLDTCYRLRIGGDYQIDYPRNVSLDEVKARAKRKLRELLAMAIVESEAHDEIEAPAPEVKPDRKTVAGSFGLTDREAEMLVRIATTDYNEDDPSKATWANVVCENRADSALVSNLSQKAMIVCSGRGKEATIELTGRGLMAYRSLAPDSEYAKECDARDDEQAVAERSHPNL
jgi:hypothetical protein